MHLVKLPTCPFWHSILDSTSVRLVSTFRIEFKLLWAPVQFCWLGFIVWCKQENDAQWANLMLWSSKRFINSEHRFLLGTLASKSSYKSRQYYLVVRITSLQSCQSRGAASWHSLYHLILTLWINSHYII